MCGLFGIHANDRDVARLTYFGLFALQHRGQESAGIAVSSLAQASRNHPKNSSALLRIIVSGRSASEFVDQIPVLIPLI